jgi:hypothetical protein
MAYVLTKSLLLISFMTALLYKIDKISDPNTVNHTKHLINASPPFKAFYLIIFATPTKHHNEKSTIDHLFI